MPGPLNGIRVFDMTMMMMGPWSTKLLGGLGADVIQVVRSDQDLETFLKGPLPLMGGTSIRYLACNMNKRSVSLDLKSEEDQEFARALVGTCDVFICNMRTGVPDRLGLGYDVMSKINPGLVYVLATGFGRDGPRANDQSMDTIAQASTGFWSTQGARGGPAELYRHGTQHDAGTGNIVAMSAILGLLARKKTGKGQVVDLTMIDAGATLQTPRFAEFFAGVDHEPRGSSAFATAPDRAFLCEDKRWLGVSVTSEPEWQRLCGLIERDDLVADPRFCTNVARLENREALEAILEPIFADKPQTYWMIHLDKIDVPCGAPMGWQDLRYHAQVTANDYITEANTDTWGKFWTGGPPWRFSKTPSQSLPVPYPGGDTEDIRAEVAHAEPNPPAPEHPPVLTDGPLQGYRVIEFAEGVAGPMTGQLLGDAGAEVIKVETGTGDHARGWGTPAADGTSAVFSGLNRNKRSMVIDGPSDPAFAALCAKANVLVVDHGTLDVDAVMAANPNLIVCVISGWGPEGPWKDRAGSELAAQLSAEATTALGRIGEEPVRLGTDHASIITSFYATQAIGAALLVADEVGGQRIDVSLFGSLLEMRSLMWVGLSNPDKWWGHVENYVKPPSTGYTFKDGAALFGLKRSGGDEEFDQLLDELHITIARDDPRWEMFANDGGGADPYAHLVKDIWNSGFSQFTIAEVKEITAKYGGMVTPLYTYQQVVDDVQVQHNHMIIDIDTGGSHTMRGLRPPWKFSETPASVRRPPPHLGEHTEEIRKEFQIGV